jgi:hypothetical protein
MHGCSSIQVTTIRLQTMRRNTSNGFCVFGVETLLERCNTSECVKSGMTSLLPPIKNYGQRRPIPLQKPNLRDVGLRRLDRIARQQPHIDGGARAEGQHVGLLGGV